MNYFNIFDFSPSSLLQLPFRLLTNSSEFSFSNSSFDECADCQIAGTRLPEDYDRLEKLKSEFFSQMSHEIRTPLNNILIFCDLIRNEMGNVVSDELNEAFRIMEQSGRRIIRTVEQILFFSELKSGLYNPTYKSLSVYDFILENLYLLYKEIAKDKKIGFSVKNLTDDSIVNVDANALYHILNHVLDNAFKFTKSGDVEVLVISDEGTVVITVIDTGVGISKEYMSKIFEPFTQEEQGYTRGYDGNGLGLALVKEYCKIIGAEVRIKSRKNEGTAFSIILNG